MTHYHTIVLINPDVKDVRAEVAGLLAPFDEKLQVEPYVVEMDQSKLEAMMDYYETANLAELARQMPDWIKKEGLVEADKLYYKTTDNPNSKWDWYRVGGSWDGILFGMDRSTASRAKRSAHHESLEYNSRPVHELPGFESLDCYAVVTPQGDWHSRGRMGWFAISHGDISIDEWIRKGNSILADYKAAIAVSIDCHI